MQNCATACGDIELLGNPESGCKLSTRGNPIDRLVFKGCDVTIPQPETNEALKTLFDSGLIVFSSNLANITLGDPTTEEVLISDCGVPLQVITGRQFTAEDRIAIDVANFSPSVNANYRDYAFWQDKYKQQMNMHFGTVRCNGDITWARDENGMFLNMSLLVYLNFQRPSSNTGKFVEFKNIQITANGDYLGLHNVPTTNWINAGIKL